ncbi:hypothetical protein CFPU101_30820 [Chroococcus sp. FPU101]|nr:hypothetical protein CFPU101_30820 [Chroococcus sp. FPU101]
MTPTPEIQQRANQLREQLQKASYAYYVLDNPIMEDAVYDQLYRELQELENQYPELISLIVLRNVSVTNLHPSLFRFATISRYTV